VPEFTEGFTEVAVTDFSEGTPVVGRQVKDWDYGRGVEGTYVPRRDRGKVMILGGKIPWWMPVIKRIGLTPTLVILSEGGPKSVVVEMSGDVDCIVGQAVVTTWMNSPPKRAKTLKILFCQGRSPPYKAEWWRLPLLELVVSGISRGKNPNRVEGLSEQDKTFGSRRGLRLLDRNNNSCKGGTSHSRILGGGLSSKASSGLEEHRKNGKIEFYPS